MSILFRLENDCEMSPYQTRSRVSQNVTSRKSCGRVPSFQNSLRFGAYMEIMFCSSLEDICFNILHLELVWARGTGRDFDMFNRHAQ